jgi:hypothetical protein
MDSIYMAYFTHLVLEVAETAEAVLVIHLVHQEEFAVNGFAAYPGKNVCVLAGLAGRVRAERHVGSFN